MIELYLILYDVTTKKQFRKDFKCEYDMDKFKRKLNYSKKIYVIKDSRDNYFWD